MKQAVTITGIAVAILLIGSPLLWAASLEISPIGKVGGYFIKTDPVCGTTSLVWTGGTRKHFREEPGEGLMTVAPGPVVDILAPGSTCWRLEFGSPGDFDWAVIKEALRLFHSVEVGAVNTCHVVHWMKAVKCHSVQATFYAPYERRLFEIRKGDKVAVISVLVPGDGAAVVYDDVRVTRTYTECTNVTEMEVLSATGLCAGVGDTPHFGNGCTGGTNKWRFEERPTPNDREETTTWGNIKAVYGD